MRLKVGGSSFVPALVRRCIDGKFQVMGSGKTIPRGKVHMPLCSRVAPTSKELSKLASLARNVVMYTGRELMWQSCLVVDVANIGTKFLTRQMKSQNHRGTEPTKHWLADTVVQVVKDHFLGGPYAASTLQEIFGCLVPTNSSGQRLMAPEQCIGIIANIESLTRIYAVMRDHGIIDLNDVPEIVHYPGGEKKMKADIGALEQMLESFNIALPDFKRHMSQLSNVEIYLHQERWVAIYHAVFIQYHPNYFLTP